MKRVNEETNRGEGGRKRVRFDPNTKDSNAEDKPSLSKVPKPRKAKREGDEFDILGRRIDEATSSNTALGEDSTVDNRKHTLDSDEEDEKHELKKLDINSIHGQEKATIDYEGSIKIMPFNMSEENEEGNFDEEGNFIFKKDKDDIRDEWLDNLDWDSVKQKAGNQWQKMNDEDDEAEDATNIDGIAACERILKYLDDKQLAPKDNLTINDILKKLNLQKNLSAAEERKRRWDAKKKGIEYKNEFSESANDLTGAVDDLISLGHMEAYAMNRQGIFDLYEKLEIAKELADRERKRQAEGDAAKTETTQDLINNLMSDDDEEMEQEKSEIKI